LKKVFSINCHLSNETCQKGQAFALFALYVSWGLPGGGRPARKAPGPKIWGQYFQVFAGRPASTPITFENLFVTTRAALFSLPAAQCVNCCVYSLVPHAVLQHHIHTLQ
jgi:hypothetical protein